MSEDQNVKHVFNFLWPSIAAMVVAGMAFGYSCDGCNECRAPAMAPAKETVEVRCEPARPPADVCPQRSTGGQDEPKND